MLHLTYRPARVEAGSRRLHLERTLRAPGYTGSATRDGDFVVRISHRGRDVSVLG